MDIMELGASLLSQKLGIDLDTDSIASALSSLLSGADGQMDLAGLVSSMTANADLGSLVGSWLGDGANEMLSAENVAGFFGSEKLAAFASQLGVDDATAADGLATVLPEMIDKASSDGSLLDLAGGAGGLLSAASSFFK